MCRSMRLFRIGRLICYIPTPPKVRDAAEARLALPLVSVLDVDAHERTWRIWPRRPGRDWVDFSSEADQLAKEPG